MKHVRKPAGTALAVGVLALSLVACGSNDKTAEPAPHPTHGSTAASASASGSAVPQQPVPAAFDNTKGWAVTEDSSGGSYDQPTLLPDSGLLLLHWATADRTSERLVARDAKTGAGVGVFGTSTAGGESILVYPHH